MAASGEIMNNAWCDRPMMYLSGRYFLTGNHLVKPLLDALTTDDVKGL